MGVITAKTKKDPSTISAAHAIMAPRIAMMSTLMGGTEAMRAAGHVYLPQEAGESDDNYQARLSKTVLLNYFLRTVESLVGKPFSKPIVLGDDMPDQLKTLAENIDRQGNHLNVFARKWFRDSLAKGLSHVLVDFPDTTGQNIQTLEQERAAKNMPYCVHILPENIIAAYSENVAGEERLTHIRIYEVETKRDGFDEYEVEYVRILEPGTWELYKNKNPKGSQKSNWVFEKRGTTSLDFIPLVTFYTDREDFMVARPPLTDLAHKNIEHWQSSSDQRNILTVARFPMLAGSGLNEDEAKVIIGPRQLLTTVSPDGKYYYVEHTGKAIEGGQQDLEDLKSEMGMLGIELLSKSGQMTATAKAIDTSENISMLQALALNFGDAMEKVFQYMADWLKLPSGGSVTVNNNFGLKLNQEADLAVLQDARAAREVSHETYISELKRRSVLADEFDMVEDQVLLDAEQVKETAEMVFQMKLQAENLAPPGGPPNKKPLPKNLHANSNKPNISMG